MREARRRARSTCIGHVLASAEGECAQLRRAVAHGREVGDKKAGGEVKGVQRMEVLANVVHCEVGEHHTVAEEQFRDVGAPEI